MTVNSLKKIDLIHALSRRLEHVSINDLELAVKEIFKIFEDCFTSKKRIEIRGFGSFFISRRCSRIARNPRYGNSIFVSDRLVPCFRSGKLLREKLNISKK